MSSDLRLPRPLFPILWFDEVPLEAANACLEAWGHRMGPIHRPMDSAICHALVQGDRPVAVTVSSTLIMPNVGGVDGYNRENTVELSRLCAERPGLCRIALRMWREFVFPTLGFERAISYQDADLHSGATYRFDGWQRLGFSHSGPDRRSGRAGRNKYIWGWPREASANAAP